MALFWRKKSQDTVLPTEIQDYYQTEKRERAWVAWALGLATFIGTALLVLGLFTGGRWAYRKLTSDPATPVAVQQDATPQDPDKSFNQTPSSTTPPSTTPASQNTPPTSTPTTTPQTSSTSTSRTNASSNLPNTGPGDTLAIFVVVSLVGYVLHRRYLATRYKSH